MPGLANTGRSPPPPLTLNPLGSRILAALDGQTPVGDLLSREGSCHHCGAGASTLAADPIGNVYPCVQWRRAIGNLHERPMAELWQGSQELERVRAAAVAVKAQFAAWPADERPAGFCPALAEQRTGSPLKPDPEIRWGMAAMWRVGRGVSQATDPLAPSPPAGEGWGEGEVARRSPLWHKHLAADSFFSVQGLTS